MQALKSLAAFASRFRRRLWQVGLRLKLRRLYPGVVVSFPENVRIGEGVSMAPDVHLGASNRGEISIGDRCAIASGTRIVTATHHPDVLPVASVGINRSVRIGDDVWIGTAALILPGVTVHDGAIIAAGAVVSRDVPPDSLVGGVPARVIRTLEPRAKRLAEGARLREARLAEVAGGLETDCQPATDI